MGDRAFSACEFLIQKGRDICLEPSPSVHGKSADAEYPDRMIPGICEKLDVEVSCLKDLLSRDDYKPYDKHWSYRGHRNVARVIDKIYRDKAELTNQMNRKIAVNDRVVPGLRGTSVLL